MNTPFLDLYRMSSTTPIPSVSNILNCRAYRNIYNPTLGLNKIKYFESNLEKVTPQKFNNFLMSLLVNPLQIKV
jgi:hypothetical protein